MWCVGESRPISGPADGLEGIRGRNYSHLYWMIYNLLGTLYCTVLYIWNLKINKKSFHHLICRAYYTALLNFAPTSRQVNSPSLNSLPSFILVYLFHYHNIQIINIHLFSFLKICFLVVSIFFLAPERSFSHSMYFIISPSLVEGIIYSILNPSIFSFTNCYGLATISMFFLQSGVIFFWENLLL